MAKAITVYTTNYCPFCSRAKSLLEQKGVPFEEVDLTNDQERRQKLARETGWMTVPMVFIGDELIGGAEELESLISSGEFEAKTQ